ncbi:MAG: mitofilin family membrane protein [Aliishimia sp.]
MAEQKNTSDDKASAAPAGVEKVQTERSDDRGTFVPLIFGGAVAVAFGFFAGQIDAIEQRFGLADDDGLAEIVETQAATLESQSATIEALTTRLEEVATIAEQIPEVDLSGVTADIATQSDQISTLAQRIEVVEKRPMTEGLSEEAVAAYQAELVGLQESVDAQLAKIEGLLGEARSTESSAEEKAQIALARASMSRIINALNSGEPYSEALAELVNNDGGDVPSILTEAAETGVPTLTEIQSAFPAAARAALAVARSDDTDGGFGSFLQKQLGARSVTPRDGDDADAVLSRAEAAILEGRLADAMAEVDALPDAAKTVMADWISLTQTRHAASVAADELMTALAAN